MNAIIKRRAAALLEEWTSVHDLDESHPHWHAVCLWSYAVAWCEYGNHRKAAEWATLAIAATLLSGLTGGHKHYQM